MSQVLGIIDAALENSPDVPALQGIAPSLRDARHKVIIANVIAELRARGDLIDDPKEAMALYEQAFPGRVDHYKPEELRATQAPHAILSRDNRVVLSPFASHGSTQNVLLDLLGHAIKQRLIARLGGNAEEFFNNGGFAEVADRLLRVAEKLGFEDRYVDHLRKTLEKLRAGASN